MRMRFDARHDGSGKFARAARLRRRLKRALANEALLYAQAHWAAEKEKRR